MLKKIFDVEDWDEDENREYYEKLPNHGGEILLIIIVLFVAAASILSYYQIF